MIHFHKWEDVREGIRVVWVQQVIETTEYGERVREGVKQMCAVCGKQRYWWLMKWWRLKG